MTRSRARGGGDPRCGWATGSSAHEIWPFRRRGRWGRRRRQGLGASGEGGEAEAGEIFYSAAEQWSKYRGELSGRG